MGNGVRYEEAGDTFIISTRVEPLLLSPYTRVRTEFVQVSTSSPCYIPHVSQSRPSRSLRAAHLYFLSWHHSTHTSYQATEKHDDGNDFAI